MFTRLLYCTLVLLLLSGCLNSKAGSGARDEDANKKRAQVIIDALAHYHTDHKAYPQTLAELVPTYLPEIPKTTFGEEFVYANKVLGFSVYFDNGVCAYASSRNVWDCSGY